MFFTGNLRLIGGQNKNEGRLEINLFDEWGTVCHDYFSNFEAVVACKQLGYWYLSFGVIFVKQCLVVHPSHLDHDTTFRCLSKIVVVVI